MPKDLEVDPVDLHMSADHLDMHGSEFGAAHAAANGEIEAAQAGWVGASGAALHAKFTEWLAVTSAITDDIASHATAFRTAAATYASADDGSAENVDSQL